MTGYRQFQFKRTFIAKKVDDYTFGPVSLKGTFATGIDPERGATGKDIYAVAKALTVKIKDVPEEGRPESYIGAIGRFQFDADLAPRKAKTGDPMTLTLTLSGQGTLGQRHRTRFIKNSTDRREFQNLRSHRANQGRPAAALPTVCVR